MARSESRTKTAIWADNDFRALTESAQRVYWMLYSQPTISLCGVQALTVKRWARNAKDSTPEGIVAAMSELEEGGYLVVDAHTEEVLVRTFAQHDGVHKNSKTWGPAWRQLDNIASSKIREAAESELWKIGPPPEGIHKGNTPSDTPYSEQNRMETDSGDTPYSGSPPIPRLRPLPPSTSLPSGEPLDGTGATHRDRGTGRDLGSLRDLAARISAACTATNRIAVQREAAELVAWATTSVDKRVVEEALGWALGQETPPVLPRALASVILRKATDSNVPMKPFRPTKGKSA